MSDGPHTFGPGKNLPFDVAIIGAISTVNRRPRIDRVDEIDRRVAELSGGKTASEFLLECAADAHARGLKPPTDDERDRIQRQAAIYLLKHGSPEQIQFAKECITCRKDVKRDRHGRTTGTAVVGGTGQASGRGGR